MHSRHLQIFVTVCDYGSFSAAAQRLGISQPALSRIVRDLEAAHALQLFDRTGRGVRPTEAGRIFCDHARRVLDQLDDLKADMTRIAVAQVGEVNVSIPLRIGTVVLVPLLRQFAKQFPDATIHVFENFNLVTQQQVSLGKVNIGICYGPPTPLGVEFEQIGIETLHVVGREDIVGGGDNAITMAEASRLPLILPNRQAHYREFIGEAFQAAGYPLKVAREVDTSDGLIAFALEGEGATILPFSNVPKEVERRLVVARELVEPAIQRRIYLAVGKQDKSKLVRETASLIRRVMSRYREQLKWSVEGDNATESW